MNELLEHMIRWCNEAGNMQLRFRDSHLSAPADSKGVRYNLVTQADVEIERWIVDQIQRRYPDHQVLGEEGSKTALRDAEHLWIIDPIDGTTNFIHAIPIHAVSIAYAERGTVCLGACCDPSRNELFHAIAGDGAYLNGAPIHVSERDQLGDAVVATGFYYDRDDRMERTLNVIRMLFNKQVRGIRRCGSAVLDLCWTAAGRYEAFFEHEMSVWDYAAAALVVCEAAGLCTELDGAPLTLNSRNIVAGNRHIHPLLLELTRRAFS